MGHRRGGSRRSQPPRGAWATGSAAGFGAARLRPGPMVGELHWLPFDVAFQQLELAADRDALVRLQLTLQ